MCMIDDCDERVNILSDREYTARKPHKCGECGRQISPGERYKVEFGVISGHTERYKTCAHCLVARQWLSDNCGGWVYEGIEEDFREHAQDYQRFDLCRVAVGMANQWETRKGQRMPVPKLPRPLHDSDAKALLS